MQIGIKLGLLSATLLCSLAQAADRRDIEALANAKISLSEAVSIAEKHVNGKALEAEFEHRVHGDVYQVEVWDGSKEYDVVVDAATAQVLSATMERPKHDTK